MVNKLNKQINAPSFPVLTIQNKYVQSYFMKSDSSYYGRTDYDYEEKTYVFLSYNKLMVNDKSIEHSLFSNLGTNVDKYKTITSFTDSFEQLLNQLNIKRNSNICFIFYEFLTRSEILYVVNSFICHLQSKSVMLLPSSLMLSISHNHNSAIVLMIYDDGVCFGYIDDNCLVDKYRISVSKEISNGFKVFDEEDFIEEFGKKTGEQKFICDICNVINTYEKMSEHYRIDHYGKDTFDIESVHIVPVEIKDEEEIKKEPVKKNKKAAKGKDTKVKSSQNSLQIKNLTNNKRKKVSESEFNDDSMNLPSSSNISKKKSESKEDNDKSESDKVKKRVFPSQESFLEIESIDFNEQIICILNKYTSVFKFEKTRRNINLLISIQSTNNYDSLIDLIKNSVEGNITVVDDYENKALLGASMLSNIESAKELWINDQEWNDYNLRILKEKILFTI